MSNEKPKVLRGAAKRSHEKKKSIAENDLKLQQYLKGRLCLSEWWRTFMAHIFPQWIRENLPGYLDRDRYGDIVLEITQVFRHGEIFKCMKFIWNGSPVILVVPIIEMDGKIYLDNVGIEQGWPGAIPDAWMKIVREWLRYSLAVRTRTTGGIDMFHSPPFNTYKLNNLPEG
jgi:hypothetical protein